MENKPKNDPVNHPAHYTSGGIEVIDCIEAMIAPVKEPTMAFLTGQVLKYLARYTMKNGVEDLRKAQWYLARLIGKTEAEAEAEAETETEAEAEAHGTVGLHYARQERQKQLTDTNGGM